MALNSNRNPVEEYGHLTAVTRAFGGNEQRAGLRRHPIGSLEAEYLCDVEQDAQVAAAILHAGQSDLWAIPLWMYAQALAVALTATDTTIQVASTDNMPFRDAGGYGGYVAIWGSAQLCEVAQLEQVNPSSLVVAAPGVVNNWATAGTYVIPTRLGRLAETIDYEWVTRSLMRAVLRFEFEADSIPVALGDEEFIIFDGAVIPAS